MAIAWDADAADGARMCTAPAVRTGAAPVPVLFARRRHGPCGTEAQHLDFPGLRP